MSEKVLEKMFACTSSALRILCVSQIVPRKTDFLCGGCKKTNFQQNWIHLDRNFLVKLIQFQDLLFFSVRFQDLLFFSVR